MWAAKTKDDLIIEVWEKLDCESVGRPEIEAISVVVEEEYGPAAVDSPMIVARTLADEGAHLRHSEIMELYLERAEARPYEAALRDAFDLSSLASSLASIRRVENLRKKFLADNDRAGSRIVRDEAIAAKTRLKKEIDAVRTDASRRAQAIEIAEWLSLWLQTPQIFDDWVEMRQRSPAFKESFGQIGKN